MRVRKAGESLQLSLLLPVTTATGDTKKLRVLVDTGAQINLIRDGLVPMAPAPTILSFASASGAPMAGGSRVAKLGLDLMAQFQPIVIEGGVHEVVMTALEDAKRPGESGAARRHPLRPGW